MESAQYDLLTDDRDQLGTARLRRVGWRTLLPAVLGLFALVTLAVSRQQLPEPTGSTGSTGTQVAHVHVTDLDASVQSKKAPQLPEGTAPYSRSTVSLPSSASNASKLLPVVMFHGAAESEKEFIQVNHWIRSEHPGTFTVLVNLFTGTNSFSPLEEQVGGLYGYLSRLVEDFPEQFHHGYNLLCHSQGALVCRVAVQVMDHHRVVNFISLAGPQMGVYGTTWLESAQPFLEKNLPIPPLPQFIPTSIMSMGADILASNFHTFAYGSLQNSSSLANLWHDPLHEEDYLKGNAFLPRANGEVGRGSVGKGNFVKLRKAVFLVGSFQDRDYDSKLGLEPWQSGIFGFYKPGTDDELLPMKKQKLFREDAFGLCTLHDSGRLHVEAVPNVEHGEWLSSRKVFQRYVLPHLAMGEH